MTVNFRDKKKLAYCVISYIFWIWDMNTLSFSMIWYEYYVKYNFYLLFELSDVKNKALIVLWFDVLNSLIIILRNGMWTTY